MLADRVGQCAAIASGTPPGPGQCTKDGSPADEAVGSRICRRLVAECPLDVRGVGPCDVWKSARGGSVLATNAVETHGKGSVLATKDVEEQGKGSVLATKDLEAQCKGSVLP